MLEVRRLIGSHDILLVTLDTLRYDVAAERYAGGRTPHLAAVLPAGGWERRHSPGNFTFAAHAAFFAGFFPTPARPGRHPRPFALRFPGSETTTDQTAVFDSPDLVSGLRGRGHWAICVGGDPRPSVCQVAWLDQARARAEVTSTRHQGLDLVGPTSADVQMAV